ncbi:MAG: hypothetical protein K0S16_397 [Moraxellaceae bacterium]|nr:hypothetical protein [Moraxellaceae bacterium]
MVFRAVAPSPPALRPRQRGVKSGRTGGNAGTQREARNVARALPGPARAARPPSSTQGPEHHGFLFTDIPVHLPTALPARILPDAVPRQVLRHPGGQLCLLRLVAHRLPAALRRADGVELCPGAADRQTRAGRLQEMADAGRGQQSRHALLFQVHQLRHRQPQPDAAGLRHGAAAAGGHPPAHRHLLLPLPLHQLPGRHLPSRRRAGQPLRRLRRLHLAVSAARGRTHPALQGPRPPVQAPRGRC